MSQKAIHRSILATLLLAWGLSVAVGLWAFHNFENTPGSAESGPAVWPADSTIRFAPGKINMVMLAHPRCPCTRASLDELQQIHNRITDRASLHVIFWMPQNAGQEWRQSDILKQASAIPEVQVYCDEDGLEARRFGATTSGHLVVFQADGSRIFSGGLTVARGSSGNSSATAICQLIDGNPSQLHESPVFGCPLFDASTSCEDGAKSCVK